MELEGQVALVTGAGRNIGHAIALELGRRGARVAVDVRADVAAADEVTAELAALGAAAMPAPADIGDPAAIPLLVERVAAELGPVSILVCNAAARCNGPFESISADGWNRAVSVNLSGAFHLAQAVVGPIRERRFGRIVAITGLHAGASGPAHRGGHVVTGATKAGLEGLIRELAVELAPFGITADAVAPGPIETRRPTPVSLWHTGVGRLGTPEEIAYLCGVLCSPRAAFITGQTLVADGGGPADP